MSHHLIYSRKQAPLEKWSYVKFCECVEERKNGKSKFGRHVKKVNLVKTKSWSIRTWTFRGFAFKESWGAWESDVRIGIQNTIKFDEPLRKSSKLNGWELRTFLRVILIKSRKSDYKNELYLWRSQTTVSPLKKKHSLT